MMMSLPKEQVDVLLQFERRISELMDLIKNQAVWLDEKEAGERLKVDRQTIARWRKEGRLRCIKEPGPNGRVRYRTDWLDEDVVNNFKVSAYS